MIREGFFMRISLVLAGALLAGSAGAASAASIVNGGFEMGTDPGVFTTVGVGGGNIAGWDVTSGTVDYIGTYWQGQGMGGGRSVDLSGNSIGTLSQTFATVAGQSYQVTFWISKNPDNGAPVRTGTVSAGNASGGFSYALSNDRNNMNWAQESFVFQATGASSTLSFMSDSSGGCCYGPALDSVSIAAVPEPATWALFILGFGAIGGALRRRATRRVALTFA